MQTNTCALKPLQHVPQHISHLKMGIVCAEFNAPITSKLLSQARKALDDIQWPAQNRVQLKVPGGCELPLGLHWLCTYYKVDAAVVLGAVIKGESAHFDWVCKTVQEGCLKIQLQNNCPLGFGVLTVYSQSQAEQRVYAGTQAVHAALSMLDIKLAAQKGASNA